MVYLEMLRLDADVLLQETNDLTKQERSVVARLLVRLAAVETRELYAPVRIRFHVGVLPGRAWDVR